jgi:hypothetical protein
MGAALLAVILAGAAAGLWMWVRSTTIERQLDRVPPALRDLTVPGLRGEGPTSRIWEDLLTSRNPEYARLATSALAGAPENRGWEEPPPTALRTALLKAASRPEPEVRAGAVGALGRLWPDDGTLGHRYLEFLRDEAVPVRRAALGALRTLGPASGGLDLGPVRLLLRDGSGLSDLAAFALAACGDASPGTVDFLLSAAEDSKRRGRAVEAARALGSLGPRAASATPRLGRVLEGASGSVAQDFADAVGLLGSADPATLAGLTRLGERGDIQVRVSAALALVRLGKGGTAEEKAFSEGLHGSGLYTSVRAAEGLLLRGQAEGEVWATLESALAGDDSPGSFVGVAVASAVERLVAAGKTPPASLTAALEKASRGRSSEMRRASRTTLLAIRAGK